MEKHFATLNLPSTATQAEIRAAYKKLALQYHPDKSDAVDAKERFQEISCAFRILTGVDQDPDKPSSSSTAGAKKDKKADLVPVTVEELLRMFADIYAEDDAIIQQQQSSHKERMSAQLWARNRVSAAQSHRAGCTCAMCVKRNKFYSKTPEERAEEKVEKILKAAKAAPADTDSAAAPATAKSPPPAGGSASKLLPRQLRAPYFDVQVPTATATQKDTGQTEGQLGSVVLSWPTGEFADGTPVDSKNPHEEFVVQLKRAGKPWKTVWRGKDACCVIPSLMPSAYQARVKAINKRGEGPFSDAAPFEIPGGPASSDDSTPTAAASAAGAGPGQLKAKNAPTSPSAAAGNAAAAGTAALSPKPQRAGKENEGIATKKSPMSKLDKARLRLARSGGAQPPRMASPPMDDIDLGDDEDVVTFKPKISPQAAAGAAASPAKPPRHVPKSEGGKPGAALPKVELLWQQGAVAVAPVEEPSHMPFEDDERALQRALRMSAEENQWQGVGPRRRKHSFAGGGDEPWQNSQEPGQQPESGGDGSGQRSRSSSVAGADGGGGGGAGASAPSPSEWGEEARLRALADQAQWVDQEPADSEQPEMEPEAEVAEEEVEAVPAPRPPPSFTAVEFPPLGSPGPGVRPMMQPAPTAARAPPGFLHPPPSSAPAVRSAQAAPRTAPSAAAAAAAAAPPPGMRVPVLRSDGRPLTPPPAAGATPAEMKLIRELQGEWEQIQRARAERQRQQTEMLRRFEEARRLEQLRTWESDLRAREQRMQERDEQSRQQALATIWGASSLTAPPPFRPAEFFPQTLSGMMPAESAPAQLQQQPPQMQQQAYQQPAAEQEAEIVWTAPTGAAPGDGDGGGTEEADEPEEESESGRDSPVVSPSGRNGVLSPLAAEFKPQAKQSEQHPPQQQQQQQQPAQSAQSAAPPPSSSPPPPPMLMLSPQAMHQQALLQSQLFPGMPLTPLSMALLTSQLQLQLAQQQQQQPMGAGLGAMPQMLPCQQHMPAAAPFVPFYGPPATALAPGAGAGAGAASGVRILGPMQPAWFPGQQSAGAASAGVQQQQAPLLSMQQQPLLIPRVAATAPVPVRGGMNHRSPSAAAGRGGSKHPPSFNHNFRP